MADRVRADRVAKMVGVSKRTVQSMARAGSLPSRRIGRLWTFDPLEIEAWLKKPEETPQRPAFSFAMTRTMPVSLRPAISTQAAYEQAIYGKHGRSNK